MLIVEAEWKYRDSPISRLDGNTEVGLHMFNEDKLEIDIGQLLFQTDLIREHENHIQGTINICWRCNKDGGEATEMLYGRTWNVNQTNNFSIYRDASGMLNFVILDDDSDEHKVSYDTSAWYAGMWYFITCTWDLLADSMALYTDGTLRDNTPIVALSSDVDSVGSNNIYFHRTAALFRPETRTPNGVFLCQVYDKAWSGAEVTANYNTGNGIPYVLNPDTTLRLNFSEGSNNGASWHYGRAVSAISQDVTEATLTTDADSDDSFSDNDAIIVYDGTGYNHYGYVDGTPSSTSLKVDNGAGAIVGNIDKTGRWMRFRGIPSGTRGIAPFTTDHAITTEDIGIAFWLFDALEGTGHGHVLHKGGDSPGSTVGWTAYLKRGSPSSGPANVAFAMREPGALGGDHWLFYGSTNVSDGKTHHITIIIDRDNEANCAIYIDGVADNVTIDKSGSISDVGDIDVGVYMMLSDINEMPGAYIRDVVLAYPADIMAAGEMGDPASNYPVAMASNPWNIGQYPNFEDHWPVDEGSGFAVAGAVIDLTLNYSSQWRQLAYVSRDLTIDGSFDNGGIGGKVQGNNWVMSADLSIRIHNERSLKLVAASADNGDECTINSPVLENGKDYWYSFWYYISAIDASSDIYFDIDESGSNILSRQLDTGIDDLGTTYSTGTWLYFEGAFTGDQDGVHDINIQVTGAGAGANSCIIYVDKFKLFQNFVAGGDCEGIDGNTLPAGWSDTGSPDTDETQTDTADFHSGTSSILLNNADLNEGATQTITLVYGKRYYLSFFAKNNAQDLNVVLSGAVTAILDVTGTNIWTRYIYDFVAISTSLTISLVSAADNQSGWFDDISLVLAEVVDAVDDTKGSGHYPKDNWQSSNDFT